MEVICIGMPRSGTESLQYALIKLGYDHTYHGWDINFESQLLAAMGSPVQEEVSPSRL